MWLRRVAVVALVASACGKSDDNTQSAPKSMPADAAPPQTWYRVAACGFVVAEAVRAAPLPVELKAEYRLGVVSTETFTVYPGHWFCAMGVFPTRGSIGDAPVVRFRTDRTIERADELRKGVVGVRQGYERLFAWDDDYASELAAHAARIHRAPERKRRDLCTKAGELAPDPANSKRKIMETADDYTRLGRFEPPASAGAAIAAKLRSIRGACKFAPASSP